MNYQSLYVNEDTAVEGKIIESFCNTTGDVTANGTPIYLVTISADSGLANAVGSMLHACAGMNAVNGEDLMREYCAKRSLTFTSIRKPLTSGVNPDTNEFDQGQLVRVSCRFEWSEGTQTDEGMYMFPKLVLRFCDLAGDGIPEFAEPVSVDVPEEYSF